MTKTIVARNKRAGFDYHIEEVFEAGIVLTGTEIKSLREGKTSIVDSHAISEYNEIFLLNTYIPEYSKANMFNHYSRRPRKLLLHRKQINRISGKVKMKGYSIIPISIYFNEKNLAKVEIGLAQGKTKYDKRAALKEKEWKRDKERMLKY